MESSRGGPLTTFIMMLPLIVVPTVAMLKPAGNPVGMVTDYLSASSEDEASMADDLGQPGAFSDADEFSDFFPAEEAERTVASELGNSPFREEISSGSDADLMNEAMDGFAPGFPSDDQSSGDEFPFSDDSGNVFSDQNSAASGGSQPRSATNSAELKNLLSRIQQTGASEVMWFQPGPMSHGFIAFFHNNSTGQILRFECVAATKAAAVVDVLLQIQQRQKR